MNDRMTELHAKACLYARDKHLEDKDVPAFIQCMSEKFAELIIQECIDIVGVGGEFASRPKLVEKLQEHFGVQE